MGEQPIFTTRAHVFHIDPVSKRSWIPASNSSIPVSFFYDSTRSLYRIISVEGSKAVINSTLTPSMSFTKTSQKFGQWSDIRANTVYGLGFPSEQDLNKFIEQFSDVKEATRNSAKATNGTTVEPKTTATNTIPPPLSMSSPTTIQQQKENEEENANLKHQRSFSLSTSGIDSPKHQGKIEDQLKYENERLRVALAQSSSNAKKWEIELATLKSNNVRLTSALQESTTNVEEWKKQLQCYKEENIKIKQLILEAEAASGNVNAAEELRKEIKLMRDKIEELNHKLKEKDEELKNLKSGGGKLSAQDSNQLALLQSQLELSLATQESQKKILESLNTQLAEKLEELSLIHNEIGNTLHTL